jgi:hypothetical protein
MMALESELAFRFSHRPEADQVFVGNHLRSNKTPLQVGVLDIYTQGLSCSRCAKKSRATRVIMLQVKPIMSVVM